MVRFTEVDYSSSAPRPVLPRVVRGKTLNLEVRNSDFLRFKEEFMQRKGGGGGGAELMRLGGEAIPIPEGPTACTSS